GASPRYGIRLGAARATRRTARRLEARVGSAPTCRGAALAIVRSRGRSVRAARLEREQSRAARRHGGALGTVRRGERSHLLMRGMLVLVGTAAVAVAAGAGAAWWLGRAEGGGTVGVGAAACGPGDGPSPYPGMAFVPGGNSTMGTDAAFPEEGPASPQSVEPFFIDRTEVTNAQFAAFVAATGYRTLAERGVRVSAEPDSEV